MKTRQISLGTGAYTLITFPLAVIWHVAIFKEQYESFSYIEGEPSFLLGLVTILIQGFILYLPVSICFVSRQGNCTRFEICVTDRGLFLDIPRIGICGQTRHQHTDAFCIHGKLLSAIAVRNIRYFDWLNLRKKS